MKYGWKTHLFFLIVLFGALAGICSCRRNTDPGTQFREGKQIANIDFRGNKVLSDDQLRKYLPIQRRDFFVEESEAAVFDVLLQAYAAHGYYDARIVKIDIRTGPRKRLRITVHLLEGRPTKVRSVQLRWKYPVNDPSSFQKDLPLREGDIADVEAFNRSVENLREQLANDGRALAEVHESMVVTRDRYVADVVFEIDAGPVCRIDHIGVLGLQHSPQDLVYRELEDFEGQIFTPKIEAAIEDNLGELNAFRMITVTPVPSNPSDGLIDLEVSVVEADFQSLKLGVGVQFETNKFLGWTSGVYQHNNFMHRLNQFQLQTKVGWALVPALWNVEDKGPVALIEPSFTKKGFLEKRLTWNLALALQTDVEENYKLFTPSGRMSVSRTFLRRLNIRLAYNFEYIVLYGLKDFVLEELQRKHEDMHSPIRLADLNISTRLWLTDRRNDPNNGVVLRLDFWHSGPYLASEVAFNKMQPSISTYWRVAPFFQIALHGEIGFIRPWGSSDYTGIRSNFFLGGHNTVRGWGGKRLAPWVRICIDAESSKCEKIWVGGKTMVLGNAEFRFRISKIVSVVTFLDVGDVQYDLRTIVPEQWNYAVGAGMRLDTAVGKIRFDLGYRLNNPDAYQEEPRFGFHLGLGEAF